jgi:hypothetical protein
MIGLHASKLKTVVQASTARHTLSLFILFLVLAIALPDKAFAALAASVLPTSRSTQVGSTATAFATIINTGPGTATGCFIGPVTSVDATFLYQTTDPATNALTGTPNTPADIAEGAAQTFLFAFTSTAPFALTDVVLNFDCANTDPATSISGVNTLQLSASSTPVPDIIALATGTGILDLPASGNGNGAFAVATVNVGTTGSITAQAIASPPSLPLILNVCQTDSNSGACINPTTPAGSATVTIGPGETPTFAVFATATDTIPLDPANSRIFVEFRDAGNILRGSTSTAVSSDVTGILDVRGNYTGTASANVTGCIDPADNGSFDLSGNLSISNQIGNNFDGTMTLSGTVAPGFTVSVVDTLAGTVDSQGATSGSMSGDVFFNNVYDTSHQGTFSGTFTGNTFTGSFTVVDTIGDTCTTNGIFSFTK